jgi:hypothetical protein
MGSSSAVPVVLHIVMQIALQDIRQLTDIRAVAGAS